MDVNRFVCTGRLTDDPELRFTSDGRAVVRFAVAVNRRLGETEETLFLPVVAWGNLAENVDRYLTKGRRVALDGRLQLRKWTTAAGEPRKEIRLVAEEVNFLGGATTAANNKGFATDVGKAEDTEEISF